MLNAISNLYRMDIADPEARAGDQFVTLTVICIRGWIAHMTLTSPAVLNATAVETPGAWEPRLNSFPALVERMLWAMVSSFTKVRDSPTLTVASDSENIFPFWPIVFSAAMAPSMPPHTNAIARTGTKAFISYSSHQSARARSLTAETR